MKIVDMHITPIAIADPPLLNAAGLHAPYALRTIIEIVTEDNLYGLGEVPGSADTTTALEAARDVVVGQDPFQLNAIRTGLQRGLRERALIAQADVDAAQVAFDSAVAQHQASVAQEQAQASAVESATAQLEVAEAQLENARAQVGQSEAALRQAQVNLDHTIIRAPVDGVVVSRNVDVGQTVAASLQAPTLFQIAQDLTKMQVDTNVDEADVGRVRVGQAVTFTVDSFPGQTFAGDVVQVRKAPQVVQNVVTYDVVVSAPNPELTLLPGMTANVRIVTDRRENALKVPNAALRFRPAGAAADVAPPSLPSAGSRAEVVRGLAGQVWVLDPGGKLRAVPLRLGISDGVVTEVLDGELHDQQEVVVGAAASTAPPTVPAGSPRLRF